MENKGYSSLYIQRAFFCVRNARVKHIDVTNSVISSDSWGNLVLGRGEGLPISAHFLESGTVPDEADIVLVVDSKPWQFLLKVERMYFRFTRFEGPYRGVWTWLKQPSGDVEAEVDEQIERWKKSQL